MGIILRIDIERPLDEVFSFAANIDNLPLYDKSIQMVEKITEGEVRVGTEYRLISKRFGIEMTADLLFTAYYENSLYAVRVTSGPFPIETHYSLENQGSSTLVTGEREPHPQGFLKWMVPVMTIPARRKFAGELNSLKNYLEV